MPEINQLVACSLQVDELAIRRYADITNDVNPIHIDRDFARATPFGDVIAHGTMSLALIWQSLGRTFGAEAALGARLEVRFTRPVRIGDVVEARGERSAEDPGAFDVRVQNQAGETVISGTVWLP